MNASELIERLTNGNNNGDTVAMGEQAIALQFDARNNRVINPDKVMLHRGAGMPVRISFDAGEAHGFRGIANEDSTVVWKRGDGLTVHVLGSVADDELHAAHQDFVLACNRRLQNMLGDLRQELSRRDPNVVSNDELHQIIGVADSSYRELIKRVAECEVPEFRAITIPFCYLKTANPFYDWTELGGETIEGNCHQCLLELTRSVPADIVKGMAMCNDGGWMPCPYMVKVAGESTATLTVPELNWQSASSLAVTVWYALDHLLDDFAEAGDWIEVQEAFEICVYRRRMASGKLTFQQCRNCGLEKEPRLAALVELAVHWRFWIQLYEERLYLEHDIAMALCHSPSGVRIVKSSFVALFETRDHPHSTTAVLKFQELSEEAITFLKKLLQVQNVEETCRQVRQDVNRQIASGNTTFDWSTDNLDVADHVNKSSPNTVVQLLENHITLPLFIATVPGMVILMATYISSEVFLELERSLRRSKEVQLAFSVVLERLLISKRFGDCQVKHEIPEHELAFVTAVRSVIENPEQWPLKVKLPTLDDPVSIGVIRIKRQLSALDAQILEISLQKVLYTINAAVWRTQSYHFIGCTNLKDGFDMSSPIRWEMSDADEEKRIQTWTDVIANVSLPHLEYADIVVRKGWLQARDKWSTSFVVIVTWDKKLCRRAVKKCVEELPGLGIAQVDYFCASWTVDVLGEQLI